MSGQNNDAMLAQQMLDAQVGVLGSMLLDDSTIGTVMQEVGAEDFREPSYRTIFQAVRNRFSAGKPVDPVLIRGDIGQSYEPLLMQILELTPTAANADAYVRQLKEASELYRLQEIGSAISLAVTLEDAQALLDKAFAARVSRPGIRRLSFADGYEQFFDRHNGEKKPEYLRWGVPVMDERIFVEPGDMVVIGGWPSDGKTALALQFAAGIGERRSVGFYSYESTRDKLFDRYASGAALLSYTRIKRNTLTEEDYKELLALRDKLTRPRVDLIDAAGMTVEDIQADAMARHYGVVIVDYLQKCAVPSEMRRSPLFEQVSAISSSLQQFGRRTKTTILALSQLSRAEKDRSGNRRPPTLGDLRQSGQIEQDADVVLLLYRENYEEKDSNRILLIAKNKEGEALDKIRFRFDGDTQTFSRIAPGAEESAPEKRPRRQEYEQETIREVRRRPEDDRVFRQEDGSGKYE